MRVRPATVRLNDENNGSVGSLPVRRFAGSLPVCSSNTQVVDGQSPHFLGTRPLREIFAADLTQPLLAVVGDALGRVAGMQREVRRGAEPVLAGMLHATILSQSRFEGALSYHLARLAGTTEVPAALIRQIFEEAFTADPEIGLAARFDIVAVSDRDPACTSYLDPLLWFKGYHALQTYRAAHWLWMQGRKDLAHYLQSRASALFGLDIHPGAVIGKGIFIEGTTASCAHQTHSFECGNSRLADADRFGQLQTRHTNAARTCATGFSL